MRPEEPQWKLYALISGIYQKSRRLSEKSLKPLDITFPQFGVLYRLSLQDDITQKELSERLDIDTTTVMVICDSLERKGYLQRMKDPSDRRVNRLILTQEGRKIIDQAYPMMLKRYKFFVKSITQSQLKKIIPVLDQLYADVKDQYQKELRT